MRLFHFLTLPLLSLCNNISKVSAPYGTWNLSVSGGFAASGFRWQDMLAEFTYSEHIGAVVIPTITSECNWFYDPRILGYNPPPGTCNDTSFGYDWPNGGTGVTSMYQQQDRTMVPLSTVLTKRPQTLLCIRRSRILRTGPKQWL